MTAVALDNASRGPFSRGPPRKRGQGYRVRAGRARADGRVLGVFLTTQRGSKLFFDMSDSWHRCPPAEKPACPQGPFAVAELDAVATGEPPALHAEPPPNEGMGPPAWCPIGEPHPSCKRTEAKARDVRRRHGSGTRRRVLAKAYGVNAELIRSIVRGLP
jgi:hypothetical protein